MADFLVLATTNAHKLAEFAQLCQPLGLQISSAAAYAQGRGVALEEVAETADTFVENALLKAAATHRATGQNAVADDSGLSVAALGGAPGVRSARYAGEKADDSANRALLLRNLAGAGDRRAAFHCALVICGPLAAGAGCGFTEDGLPWRAWVGRVDGEILLSEQGQGGFGYDALFFCPPLRCTFAEATAGQKNQLSHRGRAFGQFAAWLALHNAQVSQHKPLFLRASGLSALAHAIDASLAKGLRYADSALEMALAQQPNLGSKERAAIAGLHWHALRRLNTLQLSALALRGGPPPSAAPDPRHCDKKQAALLAALVLADVDEAGQPRDCLKKPAIASALDGLCVRSVGMDARLPQPRDRLHTALRTATYASKSFAEVDREALHFGYHPDFIQACGEQLGAAHAALALKYMNQRGPLTVRVNTLKSNVNAVQSALAAAGVATVGLADLPFALLCLESARLTQTQAFLDGWFEIQDEGSQRIVAAVAAQPDEIILDWCAGAGGKTLAIAADMQQKGRLIALDTHQKRLTECQRRLTRAGATFATAQLLEQGRGKKLPKAHAVLVDAPCSSSGALRRNPELRWHLDNEWLRRFPAQQLTILSDAACNVAPLGRLIYATCSLMRAENEDVVRQFLQVHGDYVLQSEQRFGPASADFVALHGLAQMGPDGFYCAVLRRST